MARGKPLSSDLRTKVLTLHDKGFSLKSIADRLILSRSTVQYVIKNFNSTKSIAPKPKTGRKPATTSAENRLLNRIVRNDRRSTTVNIKNQWETSIGKTLSTQTCRRRIKSLGYNYYKVK